MNLVSNAVKFTDRGGVTVRLAVEDGPDGALSAWFEVTDTGIGIAPEARSRLFQPFVQADGSTTRRYGGTGLGLAIARHIVEGHGGEIRVESEEGGGALFAFTIPVSDAAPPQPHALARAASASRVDG